MGTDTTGAAASLRDPPRPNVLRAPHSTQKPAVFFSIIADSEEPTLGIRKGDWAHGAVKDMGINSSLGINFRTTSIRRALLPWSRLIGSNVQKALLLAQRVHCHGADSLGRPCKKHCSWQAKDGALLVHHDITRTRHTVLIQTLMSIPTLSPGLSKSTR